MARHFADRADFYTAKNFYLKVLETDSLDIQANMELGLILNEYLETPSEAGFYLHRAARAAKNDTVPELIYEIGRYYHMTGNYGTAKKYYGLMLHYLADNKEGLYARKVIEKNISDCNYGLENAWNADPRYITRNLGEAVNTYYPEYVPVVTADNNSLIFTSRRGIIKSNRIDYPEMNFYEDVFFAKNDNGKFVQPVLFLQMGAPYANIKNSALNESVISISHDGKKLFFYKKRRVHESEFDGVNWSKPRKLARKINFDFYQNHASLSADGNTIFFTSENKKGHRGLDIYTSTRNALGIWSTPINLGDQINTVHDEESPFISADGKTLYFSSDGWNGFGGHDIYKSTFDGTTWSKPVNLGQPINSPCDDYDFTINDEGDAGYFASSRTGGFGDLDLYEYTFHECETAPDALSNDFEKSQTVYKGEEFVMDATSLGLHAEKPLAYHWYLNDSLLIRNNAKLTVAFEKKGEYKVQLRVSEIEHTWCYTKSVTVIEEPVVDPVAINTNVNANSNNGNANDPSNNNNGSNNNSSVNANNVPAVISNLPAVYFDLNRANLSPEALQVLDQNIEYLKQNSSLMIDISAHCDARGSNAYNDQLAALRSRVVMNYLIKKGVKRKQIREVKNAGEKELVNTCDDQNTCDDSQHQLNRRVEFKLITKI